MRVYLNHRHYGVHKQQKETTIPGPSKDYLEFIPPEPNGDKQPNYKIQEQKIIDALPKGFLPCPPSKILVTVSEYECGGTGQWNLDIFRPWGKYFDSFVIDLELDAE